MTGKQLEIENKEGINLSFSHHSTDQSLSSFNDTLYDELMKKIELSIKIVS